MEVLEAGVEREDTASVLTRRALRLRQPGQSVFEFTLTAAEILQVADISRVARADGERLIGYQREGVRSHVRDIVEYLEGEVVLFPNAIILALSSSVRFTRSRGPNVSDGLAEAGTLAIPMGASGRKPGWIVDGQQRALALSRCSNPELPVPVTAFIADEVGLQRDQFVRINNTRPLPRGLVTELLPDIAAPLPDRLAVRRVPSALCDGLNIDPRSPFSGLIRRPSSPRGPSGGAVVADTSVVDMIKDRLAVGCLFPYQDPATEEIDLPSVWTLLVSYWSAVRQTFPNAWGESPTKSRLMHGVGIRSVGRLMDDVMHDADPRRSDLEERAARRLALIADRCHWTGGVWEGIDVPWDALENTSRDVRLLSNHLVRIYSQARLA
jgi:DGQHR domain-containing protein